MPESSPKIYSIEVYKGLGLVLAAFQHLRFFLPSHGEPVETIATGYFEYSNLFLFVMRVLSHVIVTGFFLFLGMNIVFYARKNASSSYSHFIARAMRLFLLEFVITFSLFLTFTFRGRKLQSESVLLIATTFIIFAIIFVILPLLAKSQQIRSRFGWIGLGTIFLSAIFIFMQGNSEMSQWALWLYGYGWTKIGILIAFPVLPWLGIAMIGHFLADVYYRCPQVFFLKLKKLGYLLLGCFVFARVSNWAFFNNRSDLPWASFESFFFLIKHPPSLTYLLFTSGVTFLFVSYLEKFKLKEPLKKLPLKILAVFSRNGVFFYVFHFYVYLLLIWLVFTESSDSIVLRVGIWLLGLSITYGACLLFESVVAKLSRK